MKRFGHLWENLVDIGNLYSAYRKARRGKRGQRAVERFEYCREFELVKLQQQLIEGTYRPGAYRTFMLYDTKVRMISAAPFRDRVMHHALCNVIEPIFERTFIHDSYASRKGKGTHAAIRRYQQFASQNAYVLKCDVRRFFPSVDHQILRQRLARKIKDPQVLNLAGLIIDHSNRQADVPGMFPGDDLLTSLERRRGIPIGNQTSQFFGNVYLDALDHFVKEELRCKAYLRYVDDFVLLSNDKPRLAHWRMAIEQFLITLRLWLHPTKRVIIRTCDGIRFLGFRVWPNRIQLTQDHVRKVRRRLRRYQHAFEQGDLSCQEFRQRIQAWLGHSSMTTGSRYAENLLSDILAPRTAAE
ncbi:Group II intron-encoded protein LtrA [Thalassoglobus neptunius]|uniref:Group II intron-encoded protein LtrA n=1 Tax=Thalassoglobus neptunius TaxID=1938619 RepID=A0A5C5VTB5_9PLAN|nr:reverse transcriptase/maturase family protein [Thalassoglobus neptunius]TWT40859.1 Group II intron-encoded protein LtrA [Thalassoglobus neptunius]